MLELWAREWRVTAALLLLQLPEQSALAQAPADAVLDASAARMTRLELLLDSGAVIVRSRGASKWEGQGASPNAPVRHRHFERIEAAPVTKHMYVRRQETFHRGGTEMSWCSQVVGGADSAFTYDCIANVGQQVPGAIAPTYVQAWEQPPAILVDARADDSRQLLPSDGEGGTGGLLVEVRANGRVSKTACLCRGDHIASC